MDDTLLSQNIRAKAKERSKQIHGNDYYWEVYLGAAASALLAKPVATYDAVMKRLETSPIDAAWNKNTVLHVLDALSHFAPPARPRVKTDGWTRDDWFAQFRRRFPDMPTRTVGECADLCLALATTPAPEVDPDEEAKAEAWIWAKAVYGGNPPYKDADDYWNRMSNRESKRNGWRAVASAKKEVGGE